MEHYDVTVSGDRRRSVRLALRTGSSVVIQPGETRRVRPALAKAARHTRGCRVERVVDEPEANPAPVQEAAPDREARAYEAVYTVMRRGNPDDFTQQGRPKKSAVRALVDFEVTLEEIDQAFNQLV